MIFRKILLVLVTLTVASTSGASELFTPSVLTPEDQELQRCAYSPIKALKMIKVGYAALYMQNCDRSSVEHEHAPKQLTFIYQRNIPGKAFSSSALNFLKKNLSDEQYEQWEEQIIAFNSAYRSVKGGDRYDICFSPKSGLQLRLNGALIAEIPEIKLGNAYFTIWFGEKPFNPALKKRLLGKS
ncbi:MAG: chalcone isomerase family protein [Gammaproteobacteria bacterium]|nr:chalcone isomerase family protein [Gammaproteobacteria bacterium]